MTSWQMYKIIITDYFKRQLKKLVKKEAKLKENLKEELIRFDKNRANSIGSSVYKIRIASHGKGKSGGYRAYLLALEIDGILAPLCIYAKNQKENLTLGELILHIKKTREELIELL